MYVCVCTLLTYHSGCHLRNLVSQFVNPLDGGIQDGRTGMDVGRGHGFDDFNLEAGALCCTGVEYSTAHVVHTLLKLTLYGPGVECQTTRLKLTFIVEDCRIDPSHMSNLKESHVM